MLNESETMSNTRNNKRNFFGAILIGLGCLLLLHNLQLIPGLPPFLFSWKMVLVLVGIYQITIGKFFNGLAMVGIGIYFILPEILNIPVPSFHLVWPAILIFLGLQFLFQKRNMARTKVTIKNNPAEGEQIDMSIFLSGETRQISSYDFKGGQIAAYLGGAELDLTNCTLSAEGAVIDLCVVMGGIELTIPREWNVRSEVTPILGGIEDQAFHKHDLYIDPAAQLILTGKVILGGIEIKRI